MSDDDNDGGVLWPIVQRMMKRIMISHAQDKGAPDDWIKGLEDLDSATAHMVVSVCYGEPECFKKMESEYSGKRKELEQMLYETRERLRNGTSETDTDK